MIEQQLEQAGMPLFAADEPIQGWMNIGYIAHSYHVPAYVLAQALGLPPGPEDIAYWPDTDRLWSQSEHPGARWVFAVDRSRLD